MDVVKPCLRGAAAGGAVSEAVRCAGVGCARYARGVAGCEMRACGAREGQSGEQRAEDRAADYREKMLRRGMNPDAFRFYLDTFRNGMPPHGGFAIGLERITACFLGIANVKECSMFPRDINRVAP